MESPASGLNSQLDQLAQTVDVNPEALEAGFSAAVSEGRRGGHGQRRAQCHSIA